MRPLLLVALLAAMAAGCVTAPATEPVPEEGASTTTIPWSLLDCRYIVGTSPADADAVQAHLPEGFRVLPTRPLGLAPLPFVNLGTEAFDCERGAGLDGDVSPMHYASIWLTVQPPDELLVEGIDLYMWKEEILVPDAPRRALLQERGLPVRAGSVSWGASAGPAGERATASLEGLGDFVLSVEAVQDSFDSSGGEFIEITPDGAGGYAIWRANYTWDGPAGTGRGTIAWPAGWAADAVGARAAASQFHFGTWSFTGTLTLPASKG